MLWQFTMKILLLAMFQETLLRDSFIFLSRDTCKAFVEVTGSRVNRGAGFGLEIPCKYRLCGPPAYIRKMDELVQSLVAAGHL